MITEKPMPMRLVDNGGDKITVVDHKGDEVARFPRRHRKLAVRFAEWPLVMWSLERLLDGVDGYMSEHGDNRYWELPAIWEAHKQTGKP